ncbi:MAG: hypothetical protein PHH77_08995 [Victivallaceae bacterium]|nr:hypothetical protein [Victivallaceae bacterium]
MALYSETRLNSFWVMLLLTAAFWAIFCPWRLGERELYWDEDYYAVQTLELEYTPPIAFAHGEFTYNSSPLFPLVVSWLRTDLDLPLEFVLRLVSVLGLAGLSCLVWIAARNAGGVQAAAVAAAVMISSNIVIEKTVDGYPDTLALLFLTAGWLIWFSLGVGRGGWNLAWMAGFFFCGLAFYTTGFIAVLYFIFPLIFMRRPLTIWRKLKKPGFIAGLLILAAFVLAWWLPHLVFTDIGIRPLAFKPGGIWEYLRHLAFFPVDAAVRFLPWVLIAWVPFCVAFMPLDRTPIFSRFLRTLFFGSFFILWLMPDSEARDLLLLVPPVAILTGTNYGFFIRRYGRYFPRFFGYFGWLALLCAAVVTGFYLLPDEWLNPFISVSRGISFRHLLSNRINAGIGAGLMVLIGLILLLARRLPIWIAVLLLSCGPALFLWSVVVPYKAQARGKQTLGRQLRQALQKERIPADEVIYKSAIKDLYGECYYMGYRVKKIHSLQELPKDKKVVYLISTDYPEEPTREWTDLLPTDTRYRGRPVCLRRGELKKRQFRKWPQR